jgi:hypothetical protein
MNEAQEFLERPEVRATIKELADACFEQIEAGREDGLPDPAPFFEKREIAVPPGSSLRLNHSVQSEPAVAEWFDCGGGVKSRPESRVINGKVQMIWVCP